MVRAPCCEKMGLKKGPWTPEEDQVLVSYIQRYGHGNWRALPKQAGLLRCGKSCRLRWTNYLRPDIKRGNFSIEEEDDIIKLHEMLGNRWSAIAARLPGRTDNEIKNVWHTHLKKRLKQNQSKCESINNTSSTQQDSVDIQPLQGNDNQDYAAVSPQPSSSDFSSATDCSIVTTVENPEMVVSMHNYSSSSDNFLDIDNLLSESLWTENYHETAEDFSSPIADSSMDDAMDFWYDLFMKAGEISELPQL